MDDTASLSIAGKCIYERVGDTAVLTIAGNRVYKRVGDVVAVLGWVVRRG